MVDDDGSNDDNNNDYDVDFGDNDGNNNHSRTSFYEDNVNGDDPDHYHSSVEFMRIVCKVIFFQWNLCRGVPLMC